MTTACPCFGRNENCRMCFGSGLVTTEVESKASLRWTPRELHAIGQQHVQNDHGRLLQTQRGATVVELLPGKSA
jgi:hypothetical protein